MTDHTHYNEPIDQRKPLSGTGRHAWQVPPAVQQKVVDILIEEARKMGFNNRDTAYYLAIAKRESSFNPDAANEGSTASGIAQVIDNTGADYGVNSSNRFDARTSIKAGLHYFQVLKKATEHDFGSAAGKFEPLIYYRYHFGEYSTLRREEVPRSDGKKPKKVWRPKPFSELEQDKRYPDSKTVVDEAERFEAILNAAHGLIVQLNDLMGKPMSGRKLIMVVKQPKPKAALAPTPTPVPAIAPKAVALAVPPVDTDAPPAQCVPVVLPANGEHIEWELTAHEVTTDADGKIPEFKTDTQQAVMVLIPRLDVQAYNDAVGKEAMPEDGNAHVLLPRDSEAPITPSPEPPAPSSPAAAAGDTAATDSAAAVAAAPASPPKPSPPKPAPTPLKPAAPQGVFSAAAADAKTRAAPRPAPTHEITFDDIVSAVKKDLGWDAVYATSFSYIKQFYTRPKLSPAPLSTPAHTAPGPARTQVIGSSLPNKDIKQIKVEGKVKTAQAPAVKPVPVSGSANWMPIAIKEQNKGVVELKGGQTYDPNWKKQRSARQAALNAQSTAAKQLRLERHKKIKDGAKIDALEAEIVSQKAAYAAADEAMLKLEAGYNNPVIIGYLQSTSLDRDMARDDHTPWCASFTNWVMEQAGYKGTHDAGAQSWASWGEEISTPRYGAITVCTREASPTKYHVGFYLGTGTMNLPDGTEPIKDKKGNDTGKRKKKYKSVAAVRLLSGNYSGSVAEGTYWALDAADCEARHLVCYRWPTEKDKRK